MVHVIDRLTQVTLIVAGKADRTGARLSSSGWPERPGWPSPSRCGTGDPGALGARAHRSLVALTVSLPVAIATLAFYIGYWLVEDYLLVPRIMGSAVNVPAVVSVVAVLVGGALLGIVGALVAIPVAAALRLLLEEVMFRRLDRS
jgi:hypothetical protein